MISPVWAQLEEAAAPTQGELRTVDAGAAAAGGRVLAAVDDKGLRHLLIPLAKGSALDSDVRSAGVHLRERELEAGGRLRRFADLACQRLHLSGVFALLADEVVEEIRAAPQNPAVACRKVLQRWRELLDRAPTRMLSFEEVVGLYGELWHLRRLLASGGPAVQRWTGPFGSRHDFSAPGIGLEIKSSMRREGRVVEIHGAEQLEPPLGGRLFLAALKLEQDAAGESVPDLVEALTAVVDDGIGFEQRLAAAGYDRRDADEYRVFSFAVRECRTYEVDQTFPRIVPASFAGGFVPAGTFSLRYLVDLSGEPPVPLSVHEEEALHAAVAAGAG
jgi:hypothetical protein